MSFKKFNSIGDSDPKGWTPTSFTKIQEEDVENNEVPVPYESDSDIEESEVDDIGEECEVSSIEYASSVEESNFRVKKTRRTFSYVVVLQEESDFIPE
jgi:hypothetical protein